MTIIGDAGPHRAGDAGAPRGPGTNHLFANSARSPTRGPHYESKKLDNLGGFAGDAFGHHLDWLRYVDYDLRHSGFGERLYCDGIGGALSLLISCGLMALVAVTANVHCRE